MGVAMTYTDPKDREHQFRAFKNAGSSLIRG